MISSQIQTNTFILMFEAERRIAFKFIYMSIGIEPSTTDRTMNSFVVHMCFGYLRRAACRVTVVCCKDPYTSTTSWRACAFWGSIVLLCLDLLQRRRDLSQTLVRVRRLTFSARQRILLCAGIASGNDTESCPYIYI